MIGDSAGAYLEFTEFVFSDVKRALELEGGGIF